MDMCSHAAGLPSGLFVGLGAFSAFAQLNARRLEGGSLGTGEPTRVREMAGLHAEWEQRCGVVPWERLEPLLSPAYEWWLSGK